MGTAAGDRNGHRRVAARAGAADPGVGNPAVCRQLVGLGCGRTHRVRWRKGQAFSDTVIGPSPVPSHAARSGLPLAVALTGLLLVLWSVISSPPALAAGPATHQVPSAEPHAAAFGDGMGLRAHPPAPCRAEGQCGHAAPRAHAYVATFAPAPRHDGSGPSRGPLPWRGTAGPGRQPGRTGSTGNGGRTVHTSHSAGFAVLSRSAVLRTPNEIRLPPVSAMSRRSLFLPSRLERPG